MKKALKAAKEQLPNGWGCTLLSYPLGRDDGMANYISDAKREDMVKFLRETADRIEGKEEFGTPVNAVAVSSSEEGYMDEPKAGEIFKPLNRKIKKVDKITVKEAMEKAKKEAEGGEPQEDAENLVLAINPYEKDTAFMIWLEPLPKNRFRGRLDVN